MGTRAVTLYLEAGLLERAKAGQHNFIGQMARVLSRGGFDLRYALRLNSAPAPGTETDGYALHHMVAPMGPKALSFRRCYYYPFWRIEAEPERWNWPVARAVFDPSEVDPAEAARWGQFWRKRLFPDLTPSQQGFVYVPLQGRLSEHRSFQSCSPIDMLRQVLEVERQRPVVATLHPKEQYQPDERAALDRLAADHPHLEVREGRMETYLPACDYIVTQNSSVGFAGYFMHKPLILFGQIDFHHIAGKVAELGFSGALDHMLTTRPDYDRYLYWFLQKNAINAGRPEAEAQIRDKLVSLGWPLN